MSHIPFYIALILLLTLNACSGQPTIINKVDDQKIQEYLENAKEQYGIPGMAVALIKNGQVIFRKNLGHANLEHDVEIHDQSVFRLYSLTKPFVAVGIFYLIEQGKLKLDDRINQYADGLPTTWQSVQIKHLVSHSSGLPDMAGGHPYDTRELTESEAKERVFGLPIQFEAGDRFDYNQTNFWLLKEIIEKVSQQSLSEFIIQHQFPDASAQHVFFSADSRDIIKNRVTPYFPFAKGTLIADLPYTHGDYLFAAHSLHVTLDEFIKWDKRFAANELISPSSKEKMWSLFPFTNSNTEFTYGWGLSDFNGSRGFGFSGSMSTIYRTFPQDSLSVIFLTNGFTTRYDLEAVVIGLAGLAQE